MSFPIETLRMFSVLAETLNFTEAAESLNISQPTLSRKISQLEQAINVRLFHRGGNQMHLTPHGRMFLETSHHILEDFDSTLEKLHDSPENIRGDISIGLLHPMARWLSQSFFDGFLKRHPNVSLSLTTLHPSNMREMPGCDIMISPLLPDDLSLVAKRLDRYRRIFCASPEYIAMFGKPSTPDELMFHRCITNTNCPKPESFWHWEDEVGNSGKINVSGNISTDSVDIATNLASAGLGVAFIPGCQIRQQMAEGKLVDLFDGQYFYDSEVYAIYRSRKYLPMRFTVLMDEIKQFFEESRRQGEASKRRE
ncbi:LysR family transcriptional regulator [Vibrio mimicus]